jgi:hypothetical protein
VRQQFSQVFTVIVVIVVNVFQEKDHPVSEVHPGSFATAHHGIDNSRILRSTVATAKQPVPEFDR